MKTIQVTVKPNSRVSRLEESDGIWIARVTSMALPISTSGITSNDLFRIEPIENRTPYAG